METFPSLSTFVRVVFLRPHDHRVGFSERLCKNYPLPKRWFGEKTKDNCRNGVDYSVGFQGCLCRLYFCYPRIGNTLCVVTNSAWRNWDALHSRFYFGYHLSTGTCY